MLGTIRLIFQYLPDTYNGDRLAHEQMYSAATMAGMAINIPTAGLAHLMDQIGPLFGMPHSVVFAVLLPITVAFTLEAANSRFAEMGRVLALSGQSDKELSSSFLQELVALQHKMNLPFSFGDLNIPEGRYLEHLDELISTSQSSGSTLLSTRIPSIEEMRDLFLQAFYGQSPEAQTL